MMWYFSTYLDNLQLVNEEQALTGHSVSPSEYFPRISMLPSSTHSPSTIFYGTI